MNNATGGVGAESQKQTQARVAESREFTQAVGQSIKELAHFVSGFESTIKAQLSGAEERLTRLEGSHAQIERTTETARTA